MSFEKLLGQLNTKGVTLTKEENDKLKDVIRIIDDDLSESVSDGLCVKFNGFFAKVEKISKRKFVSKAVCTVLERYIRWKVTICATNDLNSTAY